jgi:outer membrane lipoprotein
MMRFLLLALLLPALTACVSAPKPLRGEFSAITPEEAVAQQRHGDLVRWGGRIIDSEPGRERTCLTVLAQRLDAEARPRDEDFSQGRFIACRSGFYDPAIFAANRAVTVTGRIESFQTRPVGEYALVHPVLAGEVLYLWPDPREVDVIYAGPIWPMYRPHPWGGYYRPYRAPRKAESAPPRGD